LFLAGGVGLTFYHCRIAYFGCAHWHHPVLYGDSSYLSVEYEISPSAGLLDYVWFWCCYCSFADLGSYDSGKMAIFSGGYCEYEKLFMVVLFRCCTLGVQCDRVGDISSASLVGGRYG